jgi:hypothetical protein
MLLDEFGLTGIIRFVRTEAGVLISEMDAVKVVTGKDSNQSGNNHMMLEAENWMCANIIMM